jgi:hypothetical protein
MVFPSLRLYWRLGATGVCFALQAGDYYIYLGGSQILLAARLMPPRLHADSFCDITRYETAAGTAISPNHDFMKSRSLPWSFVL